ncbi:hypothetical protein RHMOL_Rhmol09G0055500 [Rhododendron molle]|uniref:Uncharacterized protein n=1 Tax=Rhododendron molle TaxID=49168 RepID=A0ACC0MAR2_RHOML|nr:hypothetical protein RHMOL_Rhmol09G0055500 [Rhododendron molle]
MCSPRSPHLLVTRYGFCADMYLYIARAKRDAWDMAAEICLTQLPTLLEDPNADLQNLNLHSFPVMVISSKFFGKVDVTLEYEACTGFNMAEEFR